MASRKRSPVSKWKPAPDAWVKAFDAALAKTAALRKWLDKSIAFAAALPPKAKKKSK